MTKKEEVQKVIDEIILMYEEKINENYYSMTIQKGLNDLLKGFGGMMTAKQVERVKEMIAKIQEMEKNSDKNKEVDNSAIEIQRKMFDSELMQIFRMIKNGTVTKEALDEFKKALDLKRGLLTPNQISEADAFIKEAEKKIKNTPSSNPNEQEPIMG